MVRDLSARRAILADISPFREIAPDGPAGPVVFSSPHSGRMYPAEFLDRSLLDLRAIRTSEDALVDVLFDAAPEFGATLLCADAPRSYVDLNRSPSELDPELVDGVAFGAASMRARSGLGVVPRLVGDGKLIHDGKLTMEEVRERMDRFFFPFHRRLDELLAERRAKFGEAILFDCHSMPDKTASSSPIMRRGFPDVVLGDRYGQAASASLVECAEAAFASAGLSVVRNAPYQGAHISHRHGRPADRRHAIQIEINRSLYLDENRMIPTADFLPFRRLLRSVIAELAALRSRPVRIAAE